jgi:arylsulfatase A-like enzyme
MNRTVFAVGAAAIAIAAIGAAGVALSTRSPAKQPNVLIVLWDTARADRLSVYGYDLNTTPRMKAWADTYGVVYEEAVSPDMWTVPSHASLFTGLAPSSHGARFDHRWLDASHVTLAEWFSEKGWDTYAFSANPNLSPSRVNLLQGFQQIETSWSRKWKDEVVEHTRRKLIKRDQSTEISPGSKQKHAGTGFYNAGPVTHQALTLWLDTRDDPEKPFFAFLSYMEAHKPRVPYLESRQRVTSEDVIRTGLATDLTFKNQLLYGYGKVSYTSEELEAVNRVYDASLVDLDNATGDLLDDLEERGMLEDTIVVFTADHGEQLGEHDQFGHRSGVYQSLLHVPLVIAYPRKLKPRHVEAPVSNLAIFHTILELAGVEPPETAHDRGSLVAAIRNPPPTVFAETMSIDRLGFTKVKKLFPDLTRDRWANTFRAMREGKYKLIQTVAFDAPYEIVKCELYDLDADPHETTDLFAEDTERAQALAARLGETKAALPLWSAEQADEVEEHLSDAEKHQLQILGYLPEDEEDAAEPNTELGPITQRLDASSSRCPAP